MRSFNPFPRVNAESARQPGQPPEPSRPNYHTHVLLLVMTVVTTVVTGMLIEGLHPIKDIHQFYRGFPYAGTLMAILLAHEMGHYLTARYFGMDVSLPYLIPAPPPLFLFGTLGAFIRMKSPAQHRRALLYVAAAGPIAGFCVALPAVIYSCATSSVAPVQPAEAGIYFADPLLVQFLGWLVHGPVPSGFALHINSVGVAAWFGLLVTMLNLIPMGQLDGGHIMYALLGARARHVSHAVIVVLVAMGFYFFPGWFIWAVIGGLTSLRQPTIIDQHLPLGRRSRTIAAIALVIFILCFMPEPLSLAEFSG